MIKIHDITELLKSLTGIDQLVVTKDNIEITNNKKIKLGDSKYYLYIPESSPYNTIYCIKRILENVVDERMKAKEREEYITHYTLLVRELLDTSRAYENKEYMEVESFNFLDSIADYAIIKDDSVVINKNVDKYTLDTSLIRLKGSDEFSMFVKDGENYGTRTRYYKAILCSLTPIDDIIKIALKVRLAFFNRLYENEIYFGELRLINSQLEETVRQRTAEIENKNRQLEEEKEKLNNANRRLIELNKSLDELSRVDPLTGLSNQRDLKERFEFQLNKSRYKHQPISIVIGDIDNYKTVNDTYGHVCGDSVLVRVAHIFRSKLRSSDVISRYGGDEFVLMLSNVDLEYSILAVERLRETIEKEGFQYDGHAFNITMSFGIYNFKSNVGFARGLQYADRALYKAKTEGKNRVSWV